MSTTTTVTVDELIQRTDARLPGIAERALQTERDRRIPQETLDAGAMQLIANWDEQAESYDRVRMGMDPNGQMW